MPLCTKGLFDILNVSCIQLHFLKVITSDMQDQGLIPMTNSLEEVLRNSQKMEAKLIGYDETPIDVALDAHGFENSKIQEPFGINCSYEVRDSCPPRFEAVDAWSLSPLDFTGGQPSEATGDLRCDRDVLITGLSCLSYLQDANKYRDSDICNCFSGKVDLGTARSRLREICVANSWKPPSFECCTEEGPSHLKS